MRKFLPYILILIIFIGTFSQPTKTHAGDSLGVCYKQRIGIDGNFSPPQNISFIKESVCNASDVNNTKWKVLPSEIPSTATRAQYPGLGTCFNRYYADFKLTKISFQTIENCKRSDTHAWSNLLPPPPIEPGGPLGICYFDNIGNQGYTQFACTIHPSPWWEPNGMPTGVCTINNAPLSEAYTKMACDVKSGTWVASGGGGGGGGGDGDGGGGGDGDGAPIHPETTGKYTLLSSLPCDSGNGCENGQLKTFDPTVANNLSVYLNIIIRIFIGICAVLAVIMIVIGGIEYMTSELISSKEAGKSRITNAVFGLVLALGSWVLLNQINPNLLKADLDNSLGEISIEALAYDAPVPLVNGKYGNYAAGQDWASIAGAPIPPQGGITISPGGDCSTVGQQGCTSTRSFDYTRANKIFSACGNITITGGTEYWLHSSHGPNKATMDLSPTASLNKCFTGSESFPGGNVSKTAGGVTCRAEPAGQYSNTTGNHWHCP